MADMSHHRSEPKLQIVQLAAGAQAVINGALVRAREDCTLEVSAGACVLTGRALWPGPGGVREPRDELYLSLLDCCEDEERFFAERFRLFALLSEVVAQDRNFEGQRNAARCAAALMGGDIGEAVECAGRIASARLAASEGPFPPGHATRRSLKR